MRVIDGSYCPDHAPAHRSPTTKAGATARWRKALHRPPLWI
jgi:hypothetical protein